MSRKVVELTLQLNVGQVTCPGVYLCQDGNVSLTIVALDSSYQTCRLPPSFPLKFTDVFYFRKRYEELCSISRLKDVLKDEVIYCELVQWSSDSELHEPKGRILAKFLSSLEDVVFPPDMCSRDGVDLLMRPTKLFPGILAPKIEVTTQIRVDETMSSGVLKLTPKLESNAFSNNEYRRPLPACHTTDYHRAKCTFLTLEQLFRKKQNSSRPGTARTQSIPGTPRIPESLRTPRSPGTVRTPGTPGTPRSRALDERAEQLLCLLSRCMKDDTSHAPGGAGTRRGRPGGDDHTTRSNRCMAPVLSRFIMDEDQDDARNTGRRMGYSKSAKSKPALPCVCDICKQYHVLFHRE